MYNSMSFAVRSHFMTSRGNHLVEVAKFTISILFGTIVVMAFAPKEILNGLFCVALTSLIVGVCIFGIVAIDGCFQDVKAAINDMTPEEKDTNIGKTSIAVPFGFYRIIIIIFYVSVGGTQLSILYNYL